MNEIVALAGIQLVEIAAGLMHERKLGMKLENRGGAIFISNIAPGSPAVKAGLLKDDEIIGVNGIRTDANISDLLESFSDSSCQVLISSGKRIRQVDLIYDAKNYWSRYSFTSLEKLSANQVSFRKKWLWQ
ncbi:MAG: PDZ domain (Also known as DHR or GLGF) [Bacteroidetes bacterium ADurb.Bin397]|nr:MAG: PDZ domain (Also known as DHR or GLGF) [Bacteroidetes bacterium ADurb.Bin397]